MSGSRQLLVCLLVLSSLGCSQKDTSGVSFAFERPEHLEFVCFAPLVNKVEGKQEYATLPAQCCRIFDPSSSTVVPPTGVTPECERVADRQVGKAALHALVTQSTRGEVAAVDLSANRVLDSERQVPGYTFLDTGGLPSAIVVPQTLPRAVQDVAGRNAIVAGPAYTYVASAEQLQVRAIPTCRFRNGTVCGPDLLNQDPPDTSTTSTYDERTRVQLPVPPADMKLGPGPNGPDSALWVSLPLRGLLARIDLAAVPLARVDFTNPDGTPGSADYPAPKDAFVLTDTPQGRMPVEPAWYTVPPAPGVQPLKPVSETENAGTEYRNICGFGYDYRPAQRDLPLAPQVPATAEVQPTQLLFDATSGLLLVGDRVAPMIHAFAPNPDGTLTSLGALPTGAPVRAFVLTPPVPADPVDLSAVPLPPVNPAAATKRYLYASDLAGRMMVFEFKSAGVGATPVLQPLLVPSPGTAFADRIEQPQPVVALEIIDTRAASDYVCGQDTRTDLVAQRDAANKALADAAPADKPAAQAEVNKFNARINIYDTAASDQLRGVFVVAAAASGALSIIDVYDLDASCRARHSCCVNETCTGTTPIPNVPDNVNFPRSTGSQQAVAIRRHSVRRRSAGGIDATVSVDTLLSQGECRAIEEPYQRIRALNVCVPADPWTQLTQTWFMEHQKPLPNSGTTGAALQLLEDATDTLELLMPVGFETCATGVEVGDLVAVMGQPAKAQRSSACPDPTSDTAVLLVVTQAFHDRLVVTPAPQYLAQTKFSADQVEKQLLGCYPDLIGVELRAKSFLVTSSANIYLHRVITNPNGECVVDSTKDPLLTSRLVEVADPDGVKRQVFKNPYIEFTLADAPPTLMPQLRNVAVSVFQGTSGLQVSSVVTGDGVGDALPSTLRYAPGLGNLFVVDTAGQGLRRYTLRPFQNDGQTFR